MIARSLKNCFSTSGALYTWGETTYGWGRNLSQALRVPGQVGHFTNVNQVAAGNYHLLFTTSEGAEVYSAGLGSSGQLGTGNTNNLEEPQ